MVSGKVQKIHSPNFRYRFNRMQIFSVDRSLADTDRDGKMNINEFSIACKLVNLKLRGFELPKQLPPTMIASLTAIGNTPTLTPTGAGSLSPVTSIPAGKLIAIQAFMINE